jgi:hypothetical protein
VLNAAREFCGSWQKTALQNNEFGFASVASQTLSAASIQPREFGCRAVRGDPTGAMPEQTLSILETDPARGSR